MPITWNAEMDRKLLLAVLKIHPITIDHSAIAKELDTADQPCTAMAVQKRFQKIKTMLKSGGSETGTPARSTPKKRKASDTNGDDEESPSKQRKAEKSKAKPVASLNAGEVEDVWSKIVKKENGGVDF